MPQLNVTAWMGILAPTGVPAEVVGRIDAAMRSVLAAKEMTTALEGMGAMPLAAGPKEFSELIARETANYAEIVRRAGVQPD